ncbi:BTAD domain-containing putative transcriptional regulator [Streptomyces sp. NPDC048340]|uniref:AfsR/SARP family transcriptional regulator n=1 Tax=Streptomyces sp. NPDC048340 TaxID=3365537 RepID=UPI003722D68B
MRFTILGPVEAAAPGSDASGLAPRHRAVLAYLLLHSGVAISTDRLIDAMWGPLPPDSARAQIQTTIAAIRRMLRASEADGMLATRPAGYVITPGPGQLDLDEFTSLTAKPPAGSEDPGDAADRMRTALALWRGEPLADITAHYVQSARTRLNGQLLIAVERLAELELARGRHDDLIDELSVHLAANPLRERLCCQLMLALHRTGRQTDALDVARTFRATLVEEQGLDPGHAFSKLEQDILRDAPDLRPPVTAPQPQPKPQGINFLPYDVPDFTGREDELDGLIRLWSGNNGGVVTISAIDGMAGVGKTTLAVHAGHRLADQFPDGQLFIDLQAHTTGQAPLDTGAALEVLLGQLGLPAQHIPASVADRAALWRSELSRRRVLAVLDNALGADQVRQLLPGSSRALILITSRRRLTDLDGAHALSLDVLPAADALELFTAIVGERAAAEPLAVLDVLQLCGFLPLAVRIAAARLHHRPRWTVAYLADRLRDQRRRLSELATSERGVAAAFTLSYEQLTADQQRMFRLLGLQPGRDTSPEAASALADLPLDEAETLLEDLLDAHVLTQRQLGRYTFHDLLREHALATAAAQEPPNTQRDALGRLFHHYLHTACTAVDHLYPDGKHRRPRVPAPDAPAWPPQDEAEAITWLDSERANLMASSQYAAEHDWPSHISQLAATLHRYLLGHAHQADALALCGLALQAARRSGDTAAEARTLIDLGQVHFWWYGAYEQAAEHYGHALDLAREIGDQGAAAGALQALGAVSRRRREYDRAHDHCAQALELFRELGDRGGEARCLTDLGLVHERQGRYEDAHEHHRQALHAYRETGSRIGETVVLNNIGLLYQRQGRHDEARRQHCQALELSRRFDFPGDEAESLNALAEAARSMGDLARSATEHDSALTLAREFSYRPEQARAHDGLAHVHRDLGRVDLAHHHARQALDLYTALAVPEADEIRTFLTGLPPIANEPEPS